MNADVRFVPNATEINDLLSGNDREVVVHVMKLGIKVLGEAQMRCPVDTGRLRSSLSMAVQRESRGVTVYVGTDVVYAEYQEFGTRFQQAQPFLRPALMAVTGQGGGVDASS